MKNLPFDRLPGSLSSQSTLLALGVGGKHTGRDLAMPSRSSKLFGFSKWPELSAATSSRCATRSCLAKQWTDARSHFDAEVFHMHGVRPTRCFIQLSAFSSAHMRRRAARSVSHVSIVHCFRSSLDMVLMSGAVP